MTHPLDAINLYNQIISRNIDIKWVEKINKEDDVFSDLDLLKQFEESIDEVDDEYIINI